MQAVAEKVYTQEYFEGECGGYEEWLDTCGEKLPARLDVAFELAGVRPGMVVLDWGCGRGEIVYQAAKAGAKAVGMDYSKAALKLARKLKKPKNGKMKFILSKDLKLPYRAGSVDRIFFIDVIEHLTPKQVKEIMAEFARVLKPKGKLILHTAPNREFYDKGYVYWTRHAHRLANPIWRIVFRESLRTGRSPRLPSDAKMHINECSLSDVVAYLSEAGLRPDVWYDSSFRNIRLRDKIRYTVFQPQVSILKKWFSEDIWAIGTNK